LRSRLDIRADQLRHLAQIRDSQLNVLREKFDLRLHARRGKVVVQGADEDIDLCNKVLQTVLEGMDKGKSYTDDAFTRVCDFYAQQRQDGLSSSSSSSSLPSHRPKVNLPMVEHVTDGQKKYLDVMRRHVVTFAAGPAGSGKTFLAVGMATQYLLAGKVDRIVLVRPAVEAGEKLGYLPGDLNEKIRPYLLPLFDALRYFMGATRADHYAEKGVIEIAPLAYMRGRTLSDCFMILDEAQNTTAEQMKMFLTRIGQNSRAVITGDVSQIDLDHRTVSGMVHASQALRGVEDVGFSDLDAGDIVRHPVVSAIVKAYHRFDREKDSGR
jgi:phosphate starvation-inducible PhoH-like protein